MSRLKDDIEKARKCLAVLSYCAEADHIAQRFHEILSSSFDSVSQIEGSVSPESASEMHSSQVEPMWSPSLSDTGNLSGYFSVQESNDLVLNEHASKLLNIICRPFADAEVP
jgi:hypothetical protein